MDSSWPIVKAVLDTNVVAYVLLDTDLFLDEARACLAAVTMPIAPAHWEAELTNVIWMAVRARVLTPGDGDAALSRSRRLGIESVATAPLCRGALLRSIETGAAVYDTLFVELALSAGCPLATFDKSLLKMFPDVAVRPRDLVAA